MANVPAPVYESFEATTFRGDTMDVIEKANSIIDSYRKQGYVLTLRQLYYQFVSRDWLANKAARSMRCPAQSTTPARGAATS